MRAISVALILSAAASLGLAVAGCGKTRACKPGTVLLMLSGSAANGADTVALDISVAGAPPKTVTVVWKNGGGTVEIDFPAGYPRGQSVTITATAIQGGAVLGAGVGSVTLDDSCKTLSIGVGGAVDGGSDGPCAPTVTSCPATVACGKVDDGCGNLTVDCGPCQVNGADRVVAATGDLITIEGVLAAPTVVTFPGGATAMATLLGTNRATVTVPAAAGEGQLSIVANHSPPVSLPFRRSTYAVEVQPFRWSYEQVSYARQMPVMTVGRWWTTAVAGDRYVYVLGGSTQGTMAGPTSVEQAMINADGTLGPMQLSANRMTTFHAYAPSLRIGNRVYVFGGNNGNGGANDAASVTNTVDVATIGSDGTIGTFSAAPATIKASLQIGTTTFAGVWGHGAAVIGSWVYLFGGSLGPFCQGMPTTQIERAPINADGTLGDFTILSTALAVAESNGAVVVDGGYVYVVSDTKVQYSAITPTGDLSGFSDAGVTLPQGRAHAGAHLLNNKLYLFGGTGGNSVVSLPVNSNGTLGAATAVPGVTLAGPGTNFGSAVVGHYVYVFAGGDSQACGAAFINPGRVVQRASLDGGGTLSAFKSIPAVNPQKRAGPLTIALGNRVYAIGGQLPASLNDVDLALVGSDGLLGNFAPQTNALVTKRLALAGAVVGNNVYVLGGIDPSNNSALASVEVAPIAADGTLGAFALAKVNGSGANVVLTTPRDSAVAFVVPQDHNAGNNDSLCVGGGASGSTAANSVECAIINSDGTLQGNLVALSPAVTFPSGARTPDPVAYVGDKVYVMAGNNSSGTIDAAPYDATGKLSTFAASVMLSNQVQSRFGWSAGSNVWIAGGDGGLGAFPTDIETSAVSAAGALASFTNSPTVLAFGRSSGRALVLGTHVYVMAGTNMLGAADTELAELR